MITEAHLLRSARLWDLLIIWYSTWLTCLTVSQLVFQPSKANALISAVLAIVVLVLSVYVPTLGLKQRAELFRSCYLKLQRLLDEEIDDDHLTTKYHDVLSEYPNHSRCDWISHLVSAHKDGQPLTTGGKMIPVSKKAKRSLFWMNTFSTMAWIAAFLAPLASTRFLDF